MLESSAALLEKTGERARPTSFYSPYNPVVRSFQKEHKKTSTEGYNIINLGTVRGRIYQSGFEAGVKFATTASFGYLGFESSEEIAMELMKMGDDIKYIRDRVDRTIGDLEYLKGRVDRIVGDLEYLKERSDQHDQNEITHYTELKDLISSIKEQNARIETAVGGIEKRNNLWTNLILSPIITGVVLILIQWLLKAVGINIV
jgi:hypothetical protein